MSTRYWIGVASKDHVLAGVQGGFCQLGHGKHEPVKRLNPQDWLIYYAPRTKLDGGDKVQALVAIGQIELGEPYQVALSEDFSAWRRDIVYSESEEAPIRPLLEQFSFVKDMRYWGYNFRRSVFEITRDDFELIVSAMNVNS